MFHGLSIHSRAASKNIDNYFREAGSDRANGTLQKEVGGAIARGHEVPNAQVVVYCCPGLDYPGKA